MIPALIWYVLIDVLLEPLHISYRSTNINVAMTLTLSRLKNKLIFISKASLSLIFAYLFYKHCLKEEFPSNYPSIELEAISITLSSYMIFSAKNLIYIMLPSRKK